MKNTYKILVLKQLESLQKDLKDKKINPEQFNFLIGFLLKSQINDFLQSEINSVLPENEDEKQMTFINYKIDRKLSHV